MENTATYADLVCWTLSFSARTLLRSRASLLPLADMVYWAVDVHTGKHNSTRAQPVACVGTCNEASPNNGLPREDWSECGLEAQSMSSSLAASVCWMICFWLGSIDKPTCWYRPSKINRKSSSLLFSHASLSHTAVAASDPRSPATQCITKMSARALIIIFREFRA